MTTATPERMTAWQFLRWFAANHSRAQLAMLAVTETICLLAVATWPLASPMPAWAKLTAAVASVVLSHACLWLALGSQRVQKWIEGGQQ